MRSIALTQGISDGNASVARLVTQTTPPQYVAGTDTTLSPVLPSIAESLAVLAGPTLVMSSNYAPFLPFYNYSATILEEPQTQYFNATVRYKDYQSGGSQQWQQLFFLILFAVFLINVFSLVYLVKRFFFDGQVTDYTEPENLFAIANLSPPSASLRGACGGGPRADMLGKKFKIDMTNDAQNSNVYTTEYNGHHAHAHSTMSISHPHFYVKCVDDDFERPRGGSGASTTRTTPQIYSSSPGKVNRRNRPRSVADWFVGGAESPAVEQYRRLAS
jgi:hypothetical protein